MSPLAESVSTVCKTGTSEVAALLPFAGCPRRSGVGRSRSYTRRLYKTSLKGGSRPIPAVQPDGLYVSNVL